MRSEYDEKEVITVKPMMLLPPHKDLCQTCAVKHTPENPHDASSMFFLVKFKMENNRDGTWEDALAHCKDDIKNVWRRELKALGIDSFSTNVRGTQRGRAG